MHRPIFAVFGLAIAGLTACSGGGSALSLSNNSSPDRTIITVQAPSNIARVLPAGALPLSAVSVHGSGNGIVSSTNFRWDAQLTSGLQYTYNSLGQTRNCQTVTVTTGGVTTPYTTDLNLYIAIDPVNESNILFTPPTILPPPSVTSTITVNYPYCVVITATPLKINTPPALPTVIGPAGSITVEVVDPQNPLQ